MSPSAAGSYLQPLLRVTEVRNLSPRVTRTQGTGTSVILRGGGSNGKKNRATSDDGQDCQPTRRQSQAMAHEVCDPLTGLGARPSIANLTALPNVRLGRDTLDNVETSRPAAGRAAEFRHL